MYFGPVFEKISLYFWKNPITIYRHRCLRRRLFVIYEISETQFNDLIKFNHTPGSSDIIQFHIAWVFLLTARWSRPSSANTAEWACTGREGQVCVFWPKSLDIWTQNGYLGYCNTSVIATLLEILVSSLGVAITEVRLYHVLVLRTRPNHGHLARSRP